jgi:hypothetical protein
MKEKGRFFTREAFFRTYPFFRIKVSPRANAYLINKLVALEGTKLLMDLSFEEDFLDFLSMLKEKGPISDAEDTEASYVHLLDMDRDFLDFLRLSLGIRKLFMEEALRLKNRVDEEIKRFLWKIKS